MINTAIVAPCKRRLADLKANVHTYIEQETGPYIRNRVVVVDYDCDEGTKDYAKTLPIHCVSVHNQPVYRYSHARNVGARYAIDTLDVDFVILTDIDLRLYFWTVRQMVGKLIAEDKKLLITKYPLKGARGDLGNLSVACIHRDVYEQLRGYDESHVGYGHDDTNFYYRVQKAGIDHSELMFFNLCAFNNASGNTKVLAEEITEDSINANFRWAVTDRDTNPKGWGQLCSSD